MNQQKLEQFLHRYISDVSAAMAATTVLVGDSLGLYKRWPTVDPSPRLRSQTGSIYRSGTCASGWQPRPPGATSSTILRPVDSV